MEKKQIKQILRESENKDVGVEIQPPNKVEVKENKR